MAKPIQNNEAYEESLARIYQQMQEPIIPGSKESDELDVLSMLVKEYEITHYPISKSN